MDDGTRGTVGGDFSPEQFEIDATLLSDKLFEAFLSEPFDAPVESSVPPGISAAAVSEPSVESVIPQTVEEEQHTELSVASAAETAELPMPEAQPESIPELEPEPPATPPEETPALETE